MKLKRLQLTNDSTKATGMPCRGCPIGTGLVRLGGFCISCYEHNRPEMKEPK